MNHTHIVQSIKNEIKGSEPVDVELRFFDISVSGSHLHFRVEFLRRFLGDEGLAAFDVLLLEEKLSIQIRQVDGVEVDLGQGRVSASWSRGQIKTDDVNMAKSSSCEVLEKLASYSTRAHH